MAALIGLGYAPPAPAAPARRWPRCRDGVPRALRRAQRRVLARQRPGGHLLPRRRAAARARASRARGAAGGARRSRSDLDADDDAPLFRLGLVGWLGYEVRGETTGVEPIRASRYPDAGFLRVDRALAIDRSGNGELLALGSRLGRRARRVARRRHPLARRAPEPQSPSRAPPRPPAATARWRDSDERYLDNVRACLDAIHEGEAYQLCLTTEAEVDGAFDPLAVYLALRESSATHHGGLIRIGGVSLLSASPERFLDVEPDGLVRTRPIKGTRPRGGTPDADARLAAELLASEKERAENLMIVDLMRNDLSRVCEVGSVAVTRLLGGRELRARAPAREHRRGSAAAGLRRDRRDRRLLPGRIDDRGAEAAGHRAARRARAAPARHLRGHLRLPRLRRTGRPGDDDPQHRARRARGDRRRGRRHHRALGAGGGAGGGAPQGGGAARGARVFGKRAFRRQSSTGPPRAAPEARRAPPPSGPRGREPRHPDPPAARIRSPPP